jgi:hypothetical protein
VFSTDPPTESLSMTMFGGTRPPVPTVVTGSGLPLVRTWIDRPGFVSSVVVRFAVPDPPGRNSVTRPLTSTLSPTATPGGAFRKTRMPSDVASSASGVGSVM